MIVNDHRWISQMVTVSGGVNRFGELSRLAPFRHDELLLAVDPEAIVAGGMGEENRDWLAHWQQYSHLGAVQHDNLFFVPPSLIQRPTPRLLEGTRILCEKLEVARGRR